MKEIVKNIFWVGSVDWKQKKFHGNDYITRHGSTQNSYLIKGQKNILIDTVSKKTSSSFFKNLQKAINLKKISAIIINHAENDHSGSLPLLMKMIPLCPIYCTLTTMKFLEGQYGKNNWNFVVVKNGDSIGIGDEKKLIFIEMRMLHWPDSMATFLTGDNILFSNDAFGQHYANEKLFNDLVDQSILYDEALQYFVNILYPFASILKKKLEELKSLPINIIAPSHGVVWRNNPLQIIYNYDQWLNGKNKKDEIVIIFDSISDSTKKLASIITKNIKNIAPKISVKLFSLSKNVDRNKIASDIFTAKAVLFGSPTVNNYPLSSIIGLLSFLKTIRLKFKASVFGCYGWSGEAPQIMLDFLKKIGAETNDECLKILWNSCLYDKNIKEKVTIFVEKFLNWVLEQDKK